MKAEDLPPGCTCLIDHQEPGCRLNLDNCPVHTPAMDLARRARGGRGEIDAPPGKFESAAKGLPWPPTAEPPGPFCNDRYERIGGRQPEDRIVECGRLLGHADDHHEYVDGKVANAWANPSAAHPDHVVEPADEAHSPHISAWDGCLCECPRCHVGEFCICPDCKATSTEGHMHHPEPVVEAPRTDNDVIAEIVIRYLEAEPGEEATDVYGELVHAVMVVKHRTSPEWAPREEAS